MLRFGVRRFALLCVACGAVSMVWLPALAGARPVAGVARGVVAAIFLFPRKSLVFTTSRIGRLNSRADVLHVREDSSPVSGRRHLWSLLAFSISLCHFVVT